MGPGLPLEVGFPLVGLGLRVEALGRDVRPSPPVKVAKASAATATPARITATHPKAARRLLEGGGCASGGLVVSRPAVSLGIVRVSVSQSWFFSVSVAGLTMRPSGIGDRADPIDPVWRLAAGD